MEESQIEKEAKRTGQTGAAEARQDPGMKLVAEMLSTNTLEIRPQFDFDNDTGFAYPAVEQALGVGSDETVPILQELTARGILKRTFADRIFRCPQCRSVNMRPTLHCSKCGSADIVRGRVLEHVACRYSGVEEEFAVKGKYVCPRCRVELRTIGTDYESRGVQRKCRGCGELFEVPAIKWRCLKCSTLSDETRVGGTDVFLYTLDDTRRDWLEFELKYKARFVDLLREQGYAVTEDARVKGRSGAEHTLDMLATRDDGIVAHSIVVGFEVSREKIGLDPVLDFDVKAYDCGFQNKMLVIMPDLSEEARRFAQRQRIVILEPAGLEKALAGGAVRPGAGSPEGAFRFESRSQLVAYLEGRGYEVKEHARVSGWSGAIHELDVLATRDEGFITHSIAIGFEVAEEPVGLKTLFSFDDKAYDAGILNKVFIAVPGLDKEAKAFARRQRIKVFEVKQLEPAPPEEPED